VKRGFSLLEILLVMGLVSLLMSILLSVVVQMARMTRTTTQAALRRKHWIEASEVLRWQLRSLHLPPRGKEAPKNAIAVGLVGTPETPLWGEPGQSEGRDSLSFLTTAPKRQKGVCEVGFSLRPRNSASGNSFDLVYREFPLRNRAGLHPVGLDSSEAPWKVLLDDVSHLSVDYSDDGWIWRRDWSETNIPQRIRIHLEARSLPALDFQVTPGSGGGRW